MGQEIMRLEDIRIGVTRTVTIETLIATGTTRGQDRNPTSGTFLVFDPKREVKGRADSGSTTTLVDTDLTEADDFWNGMPLLIRLASGAEYTTEVTDFVAASDTLTFLAIPEAVVADTGYRLLGYPVLARAAATISGNEGSYQIGPNDVTKNAGKRVLVYVADFGSDTEEMVGVLDVLPSRDQGNA